MGFGRDHKEAKIR